jgi:hypothetical protein
LIYYLKISYLIILNKKGIAFAYQSTIHQQSEKLIHQYEKRLLEKDERIKELKEIIAELKEKNQNTK